LDTYEEGRLATKADDFESSLGPYVKVVEDELRRRRANQTPLEGLASDFVENGGKRLRPSLVLLVAESLKGSYAEALPVALAYELAHAASLTQDDIIDDSPTRHNLPTAHTKHGITTAILLSDMMIFDIFEELASYSETGLSKDQLSTLLQYVAKSAKQAAEGEFLEMELAKKGEATVQDYVRLASLKTGALFGAAAASGAVVGGGKARVVKEMFEFGTNLGVAFQVADDILDVTGRSEEMGKPMLKDLQNNATNIITIHALAHADPKRRATLRSMMVRSTFGLVDVVELLEIFDDLGSVEYASALCRKHAALARAKLRSLPEGRPKQVLLGITGWLEARRR
jgi:geranylgeranyl pyrophosphate synthase